ncbi:MAG: YicC family protein [Rhodanobacter sp.]|nr:MAG: YicC family protein [Rhodanobacter sp.]TAM13364.1 MAG: YicC family protein [Rhodanobacter sp.]TAM35077.1 MAG: YicC family protein [Rhodanobacter sp.]
MIRSMTAFASAETSGPAGVLGCELRTVNHRYLEISPRLPDELRALESPLRERIGARLARGKVDVTVRRADAADAPLEVDEAFLAKAAKLAREIDAHFPSLRVEFTELLRYPGVLRRSAVDPEAQQAALMAVVDQALDALVATREREGAKLAQILRDRLAAIEKAVAQVREWMPQINAALRARLEARLGEFRQGTDPGRLEQELVLQVTRADVDEELDRLSTHVAETRRVLGLDEPVGRRLDFLMQEFNREANTLGSKSVDARTTNAAVELKVLIEQMREQVQNVE